MLANEYNTTKPYLANGFVRIIDTMPHATPDNPGDYAVVQAARVSYGKGTKTVRDDEKLINYLMKHHHTSPFEMIELKFHLKIPLFVARQLVRHRTASINEISARYSEVSEDFYVPDLERITTQSTTNKQCSSLEPISDQKGAREIIEQNNKRAYEEYRKLLDMGVSRELARVVLPLTWFTEMFWKIDMHNFLRFVGLRVASNAQIEIRKLANAMFFVVKPLFPVVCGAWFEHVGKKIDIDFENDLA